ARDGHVALGGRDAAEAGVGERDAASEVERGAGEAAGAVTVGAVDVEPGAGAVFDRGGGVREGREEPGGVERALGSGEVPDSREGGELRDVHAEAEDVVVAVELAARQAEG